LLLPNAVLVLGGANRRNGSIEDATAHIDFPAAYLRTLSRTPREKSMSEIEAVRAMLRQLVQRPRPPVGDMRAAYDAWGAANPLPEGATSGPCALNGVAGLKITPKGARARGALLYLHGGGYGIGSSQSHAHMAARLAEAAGVTAYVMDYRLAPETRYPGALDDAVASYRALLDGGAAAHDIIIAGDSAGGGLTLATALALKAKGLPQPAGLFCISPWANLAQTGPSYAAMASADLIVSKEDLDEWAALYLGDGSRNDPFVSPVHGDFTGLAPILIHVGSDEVLLSDSTLVAERAGLARVPVTLTIAPEMPHVWHFMWAQLSAARAAIADAGAWMAARLAEV
jgi:epsilon-lactone hydrolase